MAPKSILVMRHAEKPDDVYDPELSAAGKIRADALATFIPSYFGAPDFIFATAISRHSVRPYDTVVPLAKAIRVFVDANFANSDYDVLAEKLLNKAKYDGFLVLGCWHPVRSRTSWMPFRHLPAHIRTLGAKISST